MRFSSYAAGLLVCTAVLFLGPAARAEFSLQVRANGGSHDGFKIQQFDGQTMPKVTILGDATKVKILSKSASTSTIDVTGTVDGYKFTIEGKSNQDATPRTMNVVSFNALITNVGG